MVRKFGLAARVINQSSPCPNPHKSMKAENRMISGGAMASGLPPIYNDFSAYSFDPAKE
jgi:hypothetical protein